MPVRESSHSRIEADFYDDPSIYDILHTAGTAAEVDGLERVYKRFVRRGVHLARDGGVWLEPACGTGRYLRVAVGRGYRVIGFDRSAAMIEYARRRLPKPTRPLRRGAPHGDSRVFVADMTDFDRQLPPRSVDFAFCLINTIRHLPDDAAMLAHLRAMSRVLRPGGVYAVGLSLCSYGREWASEDVWDARRGRCRVKQVVQFIPGTRRSRAERAISVLTVTRPSGRRQIESRYTLRCYDTRQWHALLARSPLCCIAMTDGNGRDARVVEPGYGVYVLGNRHTKG